MGKNDDYGYFGKGDEGYAHYMQSMNESSSGHYSSSSSSGCLMAIFGGFISICLVLLVPLYWLMTLLMVFCGA
jgi:hypothetical protein